MKKMMISIGLAAAVVSSVQADVFESPVASVYVKVDLGKQQNSFASAARFGMNLGYSQSQPLFSDLTDVGPAAMMMGVEFSEYGLEQMNLNGQPVLLREIRLNAEGEASSYTTFDSIGILAAVGVGALVVSNIGGDSDVSDAPATSGGGGGGPPLPPCVPPVLVPPACQ